MPGMAMLLLFIPLMEFILALGAGAPGYPDCIGGPLLATEEP